MDEKKLEELKKQTEIDNSKLEEMLERGITAEMQMEFFEILKESQLYMPISPSDNIFKGIENAKVGDVIKPEGQMGFDINYLTDADGNKAVPLFTSEEAMKEAGLQSSVMAMFVSDLVDMLKRSKRYSLIAINPFTKHNLDMPIEAFLGLFDENPILETLNEILTLLKEKSVELEENRVFFVRGDVPFMKIEAVDGVFTPNIPFNVSLRKDFHEELEYLHILLVPETTKILYIGGVVDEDHYDTIIAPYTEFEFVEDVDEFTSVWKCGSQPFYD